MALCCSMDERPLRERADQAERLAKYLRPGPDQDRLLKMAADLRAQADEQDGPAPAPPAP